MKILIALLIISILGNLFGLFVLYKFMQKRAYVVELENRLDAKNRVLDRVGEKLPERLVFLHHSCGQNWLADGLKDSLLAAGVSVQSVTYGCPLGEDTDMNHWVPKFTNNMNEIIRFDNLTADNLSPDAEADIIMFKSCYPNSDITSDGANIGNPVEAVKTLSNYRATFDSLQTLFAQHPEKKFLYITAPPLVPSATNPENAARAREFNNWVKTEFVNQYRQQTGLDNFYVFDFFDFLADSDNVLKQDFRRSENDSHPNRKGNLSATKTFMQFLRDNNLIGVKTQMARLSTSRTS